MQDEMRIVKSRLQEHEQFKTQLQQLLEENASLRSSLEAANATIAELRLSQSSSSKVTPEVTSTSEPGISASRYAPPPPPTSTDVPSTPTALSVPEQPSFVSVVKRKLPHPKTVARKVRSAVRLFETSAYHRRSHEDMSDDDSNNGPFYQYAYLNMKYRDTLSAVRSKLRTLGFDNGRILDIHYPTRGVVALLVHQDYLPELETILDSHQLSLLKDFDPLDPSNLNDPALATLDVSTKSEKVLDLHQTRLLRAVKFVRPYLRGMIARDFVLRGWLTQDQVKAALTGPKVTNNDSLSDTNQNPDSNLNAR
ncbi:MAG: hypothetical protein RSC33_05410 [Vagococcus sp.]